MKAKCSQCGKYITLVRKTQWAPNGANLHAHKGRDGLRSCYGTPTESTREVYGAIEQTVVVPEHAKTRREAHREMVEHTPTKYLMPCFKCGGKGWRLGLQLSEASQKRMCRYCFGTGKLKNELAEWSDVIEHMHVGPTTEVRPVGQPSEFTEDELTYIYNSVANRNQHKLRTAILAKISAALKAAK